MKIVYLIFAILLLIAGFIAGSVYSNYAKSSPNLPMCNIDYKYVSDFAGCTTVQSLQKHLYTEFVDDLEKYILEQEQNGMVTHASVYFRDLAQGPTFGIKEKDNFAPASLLKVPLMLAYLNLYENDKTLLMQKLSYKGTLETFKQEASASSPLIPNKEYTIEELMEKMIIESDNGAYTLLFKGLSNLDLDGDILQQTMIELGLVNPDTPDEDTISVKSYASLFRQLYNASYLSAQTSEYALGLLSRSTYKRGIVAGIKEGVPVAHKFGERAIGEKSEKQLHDCGVIYYPNNPYLLCVMTKGKDYKELEKVISEISKRVYLEVDSRKI